MNWAPRNCACVDCGTTTRPHGGFGLCKTCYDRKWRNGTLPARPWSPYGLACLDCHRADIAHRAKGRCAQCYWLTLKHDPGYREYMREYHRRYSKTERRKEHLRRYNSKPESKARKRLYLIMRREQRAGVWKPLPPEYFALVISMFEGRCAKCGAATDLELDHHRPLEDGHALLGNSVALCRPCNRRKHTKRPERFYDRWKLTEIEVRLFELRERLAGIDVSC